jgi:hypothetical protein
LSKLCEEYKFCKGYKFDKQYKDCYKKQKSGFVKDFENVKKTILANLSALPHKYIKS